jgi:hypothetical protein
MQKLLLQSEQRKNSKVVLLHSGVTEFNEQGIAEVELESDEHKADFFSTYPDINEVTPDGGKETEITPQIEVNELGKSENEKNDIGGNEKDENDFTGNAVTSVTASNENEQPISTPAVTEAEAAIKEGESNDELNATLEGLKVGELKQLAADSGFPEAEWKELKKPELKAYLAEKLKPQA